MNAGTRVRSALRDWVIENSGKLKAEELTDETPIIEQRIISSLQVMDLILFIEKLAGKPIEVDRLKPGAFRNISSIQRNFFSECCHD
jgi:acyl carrier protein